MHHPVGVRYPLWFRRNVVASTLTHADTASQFGISVSSVVRFRDLALVGLLEGGRRVEVDPSDRKLTLTPEDIEGLLVFLTVCPQATLRELQSYLFEGHRVIVSISTLCRELKRCGYSRKKLKRFSMLRDESERVRWWTSSPHNRGVAGLNVDLLVDIDESTFTWDSAQRKHGYSLKGQIASCPGLVSNSLLFNLHH